MCGFLQKTSPIYRDEKLETCIWKLEPLGIRVHRNDSRTYPVWAEQARTLAGATPAWRAALRRAGRQGAQSHHGHGGAFSSVSHSGRVISHFRVLSLSRAQRKGTTSLCVSFSLSRVSV